MIDQANGLDPNRLVDSRRRAGRRPRIWTPS